MNEDNKRPESQKSDSDANGQFKTEDSTASEPKTSTPTEVKEISWTASEFIAHDKSSGWYFLLIISVLILAAAVYLLTRDKIATGAIVLVGIIFAVGASRQPRELPYKLDNSGLTIDNKHYPYAMFRSFSVLQEGGIESIWLMPLKRFMPGLTIYFPPEEGEKIVTTLSYFLPVEHRKMDLVDRLMMRLRF